jgi:protein TonB
MNSLIAIAWLLTAALSACAQREQPTPPVAAKQKPAPEKVYTYVEQMPQLPGGGGQQAIVNAIMKRLRITAVALEGQLPETRIKFSFIVATDGSLQDVKILNSTRSSAIDKAILNSVYSLPCLTPGYQYGQPVRVQLIFPMGLEYR